MTQVFEVDKFLSRVDDNYTNSTGFLPKPYRGCWNRFVRFQTLPRYYNKVEIGDRILIDNPDNPPAFYIVKDKKPDFTIDCQWEFDAIGFQRNRYNSLIPLRYSQCPCCNEIETMHGPGDDFEGYSCAECGTMFDLDMNPVRH